MENLQDRIEKYEMHYSNDYGFESVMVKARQRYIVELIRELKPTTVVEVGCGVDQLFDHVSDCDSIEKWVIVEPAKSFVEKAKEHFLDEQRVDIIQGFVEDVARDHGGRIAGCDLCIVSGLLHEVEKPLDILLSIKSFLSPTSMIHVNVPNALSMHRQMALHMNLIDSVYDFSNRNATLMQRSVFDMKSLKDLMAQAGFDSQASGGYLIKPFTHKQMEEVLDSLGSGIIEGLWNLGVSYPELASEIYINACVKD